MGIFSSSYYSRYHLLLPTNGATRRHASAKPHPPGRRRIITRIISATIVSGFLIFLGTSDSVLFASITFLSRFGIIIDTDSEEFNLLTIQNVLKSSLEDDIRIKNTDNNDDDDDGTHNNLKERRRQRIKSIHFIGERHSGTTWMYNHLRRCYSDSLPVHMGYTRFKHWFQYNDTAMESHKGGPHALVIAQFREPYSWVESMRHENHHSPMHARLGWHNFVTLDWWMPRPKKDLILANATGRVCGQNFYYNEVVPCSEEVFRRRGGHPRYELRTDGSGLPYRSIVDMRRDKIRNFLEVAKYAGVAHHLTVRYEDIVSDGSDDLHAQIEAATGIKAKCQPKPKQNRTTAKTYRPEYVTWMNRHVDWSTEALLGYGRCSLIEGDSKEVCKPTLGPLIDWKGKLPNPLQLN